MLVTVKYTRSHLSRKATGHITMNIGKRSSIPSLYQFLPIQCINDVTTERSLLTMRRWRNNNAALGHKIDFRTVVLTLLSTVKVALHKAVFFFFTLGLHCPCPTSRKER
jgi:hypothetical protein